MKEGKHRKRLCDFLANEVTDPGVRPLTVQYTPDPGVHWAVGVVKAFPPERVEVTVIGDEIVVCLARGPWVPFG